MLQPETMRKWSSLTAAVVLCAAIAVVDVHPQEARRPYSKEEIVGLLKGDVSPKRVAALARQRGIDLQMSSEVENELRHAGATDALLAVLRDLARKPSFAPPLPPPPGATDARLGVLQDLARKPSSALPPPPPPKAAVPKRIRVGGQAESARLIFQPKPDYPPLAKMARIQGTVRLEAIISKDGTIQELKVLSGHPLLIKAALEAVQRWRYQPTLLNGDAVEVVTEVDVNFTLQE